MTIEIERQLLISQIMLNSPPACGDAKAAKAALKQWSIDDLRKLRDGLIRAINCPDHERNAERRALTRLIGDLETR